MKDEEMAEEYTKNLLKKLGIKEDMLLENQPKYLRQESMNFVALDVENVADGFLAGLKAGRPQWHYMKDVNCYEDLPQNKDVYYAYVVNVGAYDKPTIERKLGCFAEFEYDVMAYHVIAWCEIPTFDKE